MRECSGNTTEILLMSCRRSILRPFVSLALFVVATAGTAATQIEISVDGSRAAANDQANAVLFAEISAQRAADAARTVNASIGEAIKRCRENSSMVCRSGSTHTHPTYGKNGRIDGWRVRSELLVESANIAGFSDFIGRLQESLSVSHVGLRPAAATRKHAEDAAIIETLAAFRARAALIADAMGKPYRITRLNVAAHANVPMPVMRTMMMKAEAAPLPIEAGESAVSVTISGQIELAD